VDEAGEDEIGVAPNALAVKAGKQRRGRGSVKAFVVIENSYSQEIPQSPTNSRRPENHAAAWDRDAGKSY
jgi:hypothetical protein